MIRYRWTCQAEAVCNACGAILPLHLDATSDEVAEVIAAGLRGAGWTPLDEGHHACGECREASP